ncbi:hypothetical protein [Pseudomonas frederiksbergensis]|uniref:hypothetical protein n=1 Tax=Pseudomonas frederiksbergensis TaxID=104087 RepID=UPI000F4A6980|nr:hypothetical protein [Pseudomonas frederiksbergensis]RON45319.1 hypothetical protein BK667_24630 [Pseudomonas frederiksbergensis]
MIKTETTSSIQLERYVNLAAYIALLLIVVVVFTPLINKLSIIGGDYVVHLRWASDMDNQGKLILPHPLYHLLVIATRHVFSIDYVESSTVVVSLAIFLLAVLNYKVLVNNSSVSVAILFSVCLLMVTPIQLFYFVDNHLYFGYMGVTVYHSPTMLLLKPLSLIVFCYALKSADSSSKNNLVNGIALALALFFCGISKPSFLLIVLPAFTVFLFVFRRLKPMLKRGYVYGAFFLPVFLVLGLQFAQTYFEQSLSQGTGNADSRIVFLPFETMSHYSGFLIYKFFLSIAFPLAVMLCYPKALIKDRALVFALICLLMGAILTYLFAESGYRMYDGNFWWSGQIGLYLAFLFSVVFLLKNRIAFTAGTAGKIKYAVCMALFFVHTACGIFYFKQELLFSYAQFW